MFCYCYQIMEIFEINAQHSIQTWFLQIKHFPFQIPNSSKEGYWQVTPQKHVIWYDSYQTGNICYMLYQIIHHFWMEPISMTLMTKIEENCLILIRGGHWDGSKSHRRRCWHVKAYACNFEMVSLMSLLDLISTKALFW